MRIVRIPGKIFPPSGGFSFLPRHERPPLAGKEKYISYYYYFFHLQLQYDIHVFSRDTYPLENKLYMLLVRFPHSNMKCESSIFPSKRSKVLEQGYIV